MVTKTSVLIIGGGLTGLTTALLLARRGVRCMVVERHPRTSIQYKFAGISPRSMEIFREAGIDQEIRSRVTRDQKAGGVARVANLSDPKIVWERRSAWPDTSDISPVTAATLDQDQLEPILKTHAERHGAEVIFNTEVAAVEQAGSGVLIRVRDRAIKSETAVKAEYLIVADGAGGNFRERLGIGHHGIGVLQHWMNVIFDADLETQLQGRQLTSAFITDINGTFIPRDSGRWLMAVQYSPERGERPEDFTGDRCLELIRRGAGRPVRASVVDVRHWEPAALIADRFSQGRAFLAGDAAHLIPPTGGFGGNTGIHDAHNIAWKLAAVLQGAAGPALLETYDAERRAVAEHTLSQALARLQAWFRNSGKDLGPTEPIIPDENVVFGAVYPRGAFVPEENAPATSTFEDPHRPSGLPGARAANLLFERAGRQTSLYDLAGSDWVLLAGTSGQAWRSAMRGAGYSGGHVFEIGVDLANANGRWHEAYGISQDGAVLIRPDNFIAWRSRTAVNDPTATLQEVAKRVAFATPMGARP